MIQETNSHTSFADGRFIVTGVMGEGGFARVYRVRDTKLGVDRALKVLTVSVAHRADVRKRLRSEARAMAQLDHPNILVVHDVGTEGELEYVVMDLAEGGSLDDLLEKAGPLPPQLAVRFCVEILGALAAAHEKGIIHRDIKPNNILLDRKGTPLLADFGIARLADNAVTRSTRAGVAMGTLLYMAPEQRVDARSVGPAADVYALAATLYVLLTRESPADLFAAQEDTERWTCIPAPLRAPLRKALRYEAAARYASATDFANALVNAAGNLDAAPAPKALGGVVRVPTETFLGSLTYDALTAAPPPGRVNRRLIVGSSLLTFVTGVAVLAIWWFWPATPAVPEAAAPERVVAAEPAEPPPAQPAPQPEPAAMVAPPPPAPRPPSAKPTPPPDPGGPLAATGAWRGSFGGRTARLELAGTTGRAVGTLTVSFAGNEVKSTVSGRTDPTSGKLVLDDTEETDDAGRYTLTLSPDGQRLEGQFSARNRAQVVPMHLHR